MAMTKHNRTHTNQLFFAHLSKNVLIAFSFISLCLLIGIMGYHYFEHQSWLDAYLNAAMILSGMGPANPVTTSAGKIFAGSYALFSGLAFIAIFVIILTPLIHHIFRKIHLDYEDNK